MAEIVLFHHVRGLTEGVTAFADRLRAAGHTVHTPDLFGGRTFASIEEGLGHVRETGFAEMTERGVASVERLPAELVYAGISFGVMPAQRLAQTRPGARGALLLESAVPAAGFGSAHWPATVPLQVHGMDADPEFVGGGDIEAARELVADADDGDLFLYPGDRHLFTDSSLESYDADAATLVTKRVLDFLSVR